MGQPYKRNHSVPSCILKHWVPAGSSGVSVYDIQRRRKYQANAGGKEPFSFAVGVDLYVARIGGKRATRVEQWFNQQETALAALGFDPAELPACFAAAGFDASPLRHDGGLVPAGRDEVDRVVRDSGYADLLYTRSRDAR